MSKSLANALAQITRRSSTSQHNASVLSLTSRCATLQHLPIPPSITVTSRHIISSTSFKLHKADEGQASSTADLHSFYHEQMKEIQSEREAVFGTSPDDASDSADLSQTAKSYVASKVDAAEPSSSSSPYSAPQIPPPPGWNVEEREQAHAERDAAFSFSEEEKSAWTNNDAGTKQTESSHMHRIREHLREAPSHHHQHDEATTGDTPQSASSSPSPFSHLTPRGDGVSMVDVGHKTSSRRVALARSVVVFPPEVLSAFQMSSSNSEMIGPKGPIFETAKIAGIMGAKKTSDLIPLCHPLPLDRVNINIQLIHNQAIIECECRVTHKTGVEMEALTGATIAALTIYDMVKAVSHRVEIGQTVLVSKSGGKSNFCS